MITYILLCGYPPFYGCCGTDCGWERGQFCQSCQDRLFNCIQKGIYDFPEREWAYISEQAKDLIRHLLVKDASQRYTAEMVLNHPWVRFGGPITCLQTPKVIRRNNSAKDLAAFAGNANAMKRLFIQNYLHSNSICSVAELGTEGFNRSRAKLFAHLERSDDCDSGTDYESSIGQSDLDFGMQFVYQNTPHSTDSSDTGNVSPPVFADSQSELDVRQQLERFAKTPKNNVVQQEQQAFRDRNFSCGQQAKNVFIPGKARTNGQGRPVRSTISMDRNMKYTDRVMFGY